MLKKIDAVIVEDDPYFVKIFCKMLARNEGINVTGIFNSGEQFQNELKCGLSFEVAFVDLGLPGIAGSEVGEHLRKERPNSQIVFVTANVEFAATAFDLEVTDYLVKPFDDKRLGRCIARVFNKMEKHNSNNEAYTITNKNGAVILDITDIIFIEKHKKNCIFYTTGGVYESGETLDGIEKKLSQQDFLRSHRSYLVNRNYIRRIEKWGDRSYEIEFAYTDHKASLSRGKVGMLKYLKMAIW
ncbi:MAG: LytTR family DNA-binding domain-containing protein [Firmicutes bacterium]|nr:LytTR family DNA-binding domain-containing protein [Bacillota bacterium]